MKASGLGNHHGLRPTKVPLGSEPHITIEPSMTCNLHCLYCYNENHDYVKPISTVKSEIDFAASQRNLESVSILGGEPTLYPQLSELISYIKNKGLICQVLTNGIMLAADKGNGLLDRMIQSGLDRIVLHIDSSRGNTPDDLEKFCRALFSKFEARRLTFALAVTVDHENKDVVPELMRRFAEYRYFDGILVTQARDMKNVGGPADHPGPDLGEIASRIESDLPVRAASYIPSSLDDTEVCWLMYFYYYNINTGRTFHLSATFSRLFRRLYRLVERKEFFARTLDPRYSGWSFAFTAFAEILISPSRVGSLLSLLKYSDHSHSLRFHYILLQSGPSYNVEKQMTQICYHCPDATVRNGKITPVCIADQINPLGSDGNKTKIDRELYKTVYEHLEQL